MVHVLRNPRPKLPSRPLGRTKLFPNLIEADGWANFVPMHELVLIFSYDTTSRRFTLQITCIARHVSPDTQRYLVRIDRTVRFVFRQFCFFRRFGPPLPISTCGAHVCYAFMDPRFMSFNGRHMSPTVERFKPVRHRDYTGSL